MTIQWSYNNGLHGLKNCCREKKRKKNGNQWKVTEANISWIWRNGLVDKPTEADKGWNHLRRLRCPSCCVAEARTLNTGYGVIGTHCDGQRLESLSCLPCPSCCVADGDGYGVVDFHTGGQRQGIINPLAAFIVFSKRPLWLKIMRKKSSFTHTIP